MKRNNNIATKIKQLLGLNGLKPLDQKDPTLAYSDRSKSHDPNFPINHIEVSPQGIEAEHRHLTTHHHTITPKTVREIIDTLEENRDTVTTCHKPTEAEVLQHQAQHGLFGLNLHHGIDLANMAQSYGRIHRHYDNQRIITYDLETNPGFAYAQLFWPPHEIDNSLSPMSIVCQKWETKRHPTTPERVASEAHSIAERIRKEEVTATAKRLLELARKNTFIPTEFLGLKTEDHYTDPIEIQRKAEKFVEEDMNRKELKAAVDRLKANQIYERHKIIHTQERGLEQGQIYLHQTYSPYSPANKDIEYWNTSSNRPAELTGVTTSTDGLASAKTINDELLRMRAQDALGAKITILEQFVASHAIIIGIEKDDDVIDVCESIMNYFDRISLGERSELASQLRRYVEINLSEMLQERGHEVEALSLYSVFTGQNEKLCTSFVCQVTWPLEPIYLAHGIDIVRPQCHTFEVRLADWCFDDLLTATLETMKPF